MSIVRWQPALDMALVVSEVDYLDTVRRELQRLRRLAEDALAQVSDEAFFYAQTPEENSLAILVKHMAGNMRSRWSDFLTTDGEKRDRHRDSEFNRNPESYLPG